MKIRKDFVTNSSSSSFVAVFGKATDIEKARESIKIAEMEHCAVLGKNLIDHYDAYYEDNSMCYSHEVNSLPSKDKIDENGLYFIYSECQDVLDSECNGIDDEGIDDHYNSVMSLIAGIEGFEFSIESESGRSV